MRRRPARSVGSDAVVTVEIANRSGTEVDEEAAAALARGVLAAEGIEDGDLGLVFVEPDEMRGLKREHLGQDEATDVLAFPIDGREELPAGVPRQLGDAVLCPQVVGEAWRPPLVHALLHLLGYEHGAEMEGREAELRLVSTSRRRAPSLLESFNFAFEGVIHVLRTQRNLRIHFAAAFAVLIAAVAVGVDRIELIALLISISFVLIAEMLNTALEAGIDVATTSFDPLAKLAKDIAAGAVLIATVNAVAVGYLVFSDKLVNHSTRLIDRLRDAPVGADADRARADDHPRPRGRRPTPAGELRSAGGLPSGHAAIAFGGWMAITNVVGDSRHWFLISSLTFLMALLVAQTRVESGVHSFLEVSYGALLGSLAVLVMFQVFA